MVILEHWEINRIDDAKKLQHAGRIGMGGTGGG